MSKLAFLLAFLFLLTIYKLYRDYEGDKVKFVKDISLLLILLVFTGFTKYMRVYLPLFVVHIVLVLVAWGSFYLYLFGKTKNLWLIFTPIFSIGAFFLLGYSVSSF
ncbi:hypothetical protein [Nitratiruptor sp. YY09-18]|uniref:hypothetical protein n=1 Tax=Nitratiruptor sp. YY09-18 TaxID=2724901 RepID=UPI001914F613|nr:hypothetical protein [Nitratiruptor sp. YY09-18]BCD67882.1 hypothetical protein NitYY0918_C0789 [Nitratiruptor sp. YY09-18]